MIKVVGFYLFGPFFCAFFIYAGTRRILGAGREARTGEALFWGLFGIALGVAGLVGIVWSILHPPEL
jgi:hypothetical protein